MQKTKSQNDGLRIFVFYFTCICMYKDSMYAKMLSKIRNPVI